MDSQLKQSEMLYLALLDHQSRIKVHIGFTGGMIQEIVKMKYDQWLNLDRIQNIVGELMEKGLLDNPVVGGRTYLGSVIALDARDIAKKRLAKK